MPFTGNTQNPYEKDLRAIHAELVAATEKMPVRGAATCVAAPQSVAAIAVSDD